MVGLLTKEDYRRWERWFNHHRQMAIPENYQIRHHVSPYANSPKPLWPDPPPRKPKPEKEPRKILTEEELAAHEERVRVTLAEQAERRRAADAERQAERRVRMKASESARRLDEMWRRAEQAALDQKDSQEGQMIWPGRG